MAQASNSGATFLERKKASIYAKIDVWQTRAARLLVLLMLCVQPLYLNKHRYVDLTQHKFVFFLICMGIVLLAVLIIWIARLTRSPRLLPEDKLSVADWAILGFAAVTVVSALFSPYRGAVLGPPYEGTYNIWTGYPERHDGVITQLLYVAIYFIVSRWYRPNKNDFALFGLSASLVALIGILQFYGMDFLSLWPNDNPKYYAENFYNIFFRSTLGNINIVSTYVCVAVLLCGFLFVKMKSRWRPLWLIGSALNFWMMELADSDSGRVGLLVAMVLMIPFMIESRKTLGKTLILGASWVSAYALQLLFYEVRAREARTTESLQPYAAAAFVLAVAGAALLIFGKEKGPDAQAEPDEKEQLTQRKRWGQWAQRKQWKQLALGLALIVLCIIAGFAGIEIIGSRDAEAGKTSSIIYELREIMHGNIEDHFASARIYIWRNAMEAFPKNPIIGAGPDAFYYAFPEEAHGYQNTFFENAHNEYLQYLICQGILGLLCYLVFIGGTLVKAVPQAMKNPFVLATLAAFTGYCIQAFFNLSLPITSQLLWVCAGVLASKRVREVVVL